MFRAPACAAERCEVQGATYRPDTLVRLHHATAAYVVGLSPSLPASPTTGGFYTEEEVAYLGELRDRSIAAFAAAVVGAAVAAVSLARAGPARRRLLAAAAAVIGVGGAAFLVAALVDPERSTAAVQALLRLPDGTFGPRYNIHQLYPADFGATLERQVALTLTLVAAGLAAAVAVTRGSGRPAAE